MGSVSYALLRDKAAMRGSLDVSAGSAGSAFTPSAVVGQGDSPLGTANGVPSHRMRIVDGALRCIEQRGLGSTTLDDVAQVAGLSRATVYRAFPGGREEVFRAVAETEIARYLSALAVVMGEATDVESTLVLGIVEAARGLLSHRALGRVLEEEPQLVLPYIAFAHMDGVLRAVSELSAPFLARWLDHNDAVRVAEWAARIVLSYIACPSQGVDLADEHCVATLVGTYMMPGIEVLLSGSGSGDAKPVGSCGAVGSGGPRPDRGSSFSRAAKPTFSVGCGEGRVDMGPPDRKAAGRFTTASNHKSPYTSKLREEDPR